MTHKLILSVLLVLSSGVSAQTLMFASQYYSDTVDVVDVTDSTFNVVSSMTATSDYGGVDGFYGMSLHPLTKQMYVVYQSGGAGNRRLGIFDQATAVITDIGDCGNIIDIAFGSDGTLFGSTGSFAPDYSLVIIDLATAAQIFIFDYTVSSYGGGMAYNRFTDEIYYQNNNGTSIVDPGTFIETLGSPVGSPGETQAMIILTPTFGWMAFYGTLYSFDPITEIFSNTGVAISNYHAFALAGQYHVGGTVSGLLPNNSLIINDNNNEEITITTNGTFSFAAQRNVGEEYTINILSEPNNPIQPCTMSNETGTVTNQDVNNVLVSCEVGDDLIFRDGFE